MVPAGSEQGAGEAPQGPGSKSEVAPLHVLARPQPRPEALREHRLTAARLGLGLRGPLTSRPRLIPASVVLGLGCSCGQVRSLAGGRPDLPGVAAPRLHGRPGASRRAAPGRGLQPPLGNPGGRSSRPEGPEGGAGRSAGTGPSPFWRPRPPGRAQERRPRTPPVCGGQGGGQGRPSLSLLGQGRPTHTFSAHHVPPSARPAGTPRNGLQGGPPQGRAHATLLSSSILRIRYGLLEEFSK